MSNTLIHYPTEVHSCNVYLGRKLVFSSANVRLDYKADYDHLTAYEEDIAPSITRISSERYDITVNDQLYAKFVVGPKRKHQHPYMRLVKEENGLALHLTKKYVRLVVPR